MKRRPNQRRTNRKREDMRTFSIKQHLKKIECRKAGNNIDLNIQLSMTAIGRALMYS